MAQKRMISSLITTQDEFLDMPLSAQALYFHLNMFADDEGFVDKVRSIMRQVRSTEDDMKILLAKRYVLSFESGVVVIKHWLIHNSIRQDRIKDTIYQEERALIDTKENGTYTEKDNLSDNSQSSVSTGVSNLISTNLNSTNLNLIKSIIDYLNNKLNTHYRYTSNKTQSLVKARLNEGFTYDDFVTVIDKKHNQWISDEKMSKFLRPETLFSNKFESYLNEKDSEKKILKSMEDRW